MQKFWNMAPDAEIPGDGVLDIEGPIAEEQFWGDETSSRDFRKALAGMRNVTVHINSPGGDVMAGAEIYSALREHSLNGKGKVKVIITALAASAASVVAMAGDEILISPVGYMMIHNPWAMATGSAKDMRKTAKVLDEIAEGIITAYQQRTGKTRDELKRMLDNETWMSSGRCVEEGFADGIYGGEIKAAAFAGASLMTRTTPAELLEMAARWQMEKAKGQGTEDEPDEDDEDEDPDEDKPEDSARNEGPDEDPDEDGKPDEDEPDKDEPEDRVRNEDPDEDPDEEGEPDEDEPDEDKDPEGALAASAAMEAAQRRISEKREEQGLRDSIAQKAEEVLRAAILAETARIIGR